MYGKSSRNQIAAGMVLAFMLAGASLAWACTGVSAPQPIMVLQPSSGQVGTVSTAQGQNMGRVGGQVDIRWNSTNGPSLATAMVDSDGKFTASITIPQAADGVTYNVVALVNTAARAATSFEVTASPSKQNTSPQQAAQLSSTANGAELAGPATGGDTSLSAPGGTETLTPEPAGVSSSSPGPQAEAPVANSVARPASSVAAAAPTDIPSSANPPAVASASGRILFGGSVAPQVRTFVPSSGDLWSGFGKAKTSIAPNFTAPFDTSSKGPSPAMAIGGLAVAMMAVMSGFVLTDLGRRRRARAEANV